jgi:hypothetical protein
MLTVLTKSEALCAYVQSSVSHIGSSCMPRLAARLACYMRLVLTARQALPAFNMICERSCSDSHSMQSGFNSTREHGWYTGSTPKVLYTKRGQPQRLQAVPTQPL